MSKFRINFQLQKLDKVCPWGKNMHWFGLTDGLLWIDVGEQTIYEYTKAAQKFWGLPAPPYNDYQISRFLEDFSRTFRYVSESIPKELYDNIEKFDQRAQAWNESHWDDEDEVFDEFYFNEYNELIMWKVSRSFDSGHLTGGPYIGCFRYEENIKIMWNGEYKLENGSYIWTAPKGCYEMPYEEFVASVKEFFERFFTAMDEQVRKAVAKDWGEVQLDKARLADENEERKQRFCHEIFFLENPPDSTDWNRIIALYRTMEKEIKM